MNVCIAHALIGSEGILRGKNQPSERHELLHGGRTCSPITMGRYEVPLLKATASLTSI